MSDEFIIKLTDVQLSFPKLVKPEYYGGGETPSRPGEKRRFGTALHVPKAGKAQVDAIHKMLKQAAQAKWKDDWEMHYENAITDPKLTCFIDGKRKGANDVMILSAYRYEDQGRPIVFDTDKSPIYNEDGNLYPGKAGRIYAGVHVNAKVKFWVQDNKAGKALRAELQIVQRLKDGKAFGGSAPVNTDDFDEISDDADDLAG